MLGANGEIDRRRVAEVVFADRGKLDFLERLLHPPCRGDPTWREKLAELPNPPEVCVTEVPLLYETGGDKRFDKVVVITAPTKLRDQRRGVRQDDRDQRLLPDKEKVKRADFAYVNTGTLEELDAWVAGVMAELTKEPAWTQSRRQDGSGEPAGSPFGTRRCGASVSTNRGLAGETGFPPRD